MKKIKSDLFNSTGGLERSISHRSMVGSNMPLFSEKKTVEQRDEIASNKKKKENVKKSQTIQMSEWEKKSNKRKKNTKNVSEVSEAENLKEVLNPKNARNKKKNQDKNQNKNQNKSQNKNQNRSLNEKKSKKETELKKEIEIKKEIESKKEIEKPVSSKKEKRNIQQNAHLSERKKKQGKVVSKIKKTGILKKGEKMVDKNNKKPVSNLKVIPLGGLEQIGMNITAFEYENSIIVVDCGLAFPEDDMLGIDLCIPDITYLRENIDKVKGFVITHGHEDHIGALPYVLKDINVPIYSTKLTLALIRNKLKEHEMAEDVTMKEVQHGQVITLGDFSVEFIKTNHSIQDASALAIYSPAGIVVHTGDFKVDYTPVYGDAIDLQRFAEIGNKGVLLLMADSTNAERPGFTMSEKVVGHAFDTLFAEHRKSRIIIATFASNVDRVQQIINSADKYGRKVAVEGRSMVNVISTAYELGYLKVPENTLIDIDEVKNYTDEQIVLITTGSQGESMAALSRMAASLHKKITIKPNDTIIFSSSPIPGNEKAVSRVINELCKKGAEVIFQDVHVSGHACQEELKLIGSLVKPKYGMPVHGEYRHLVAHARLIEELGVSKENIFVLSSGDVLEINEENAKVTGKVHTGAILVDGLGVGDVGNIVLRDRQHLAEDGIIIVVMTLEKYAGNLLAGPDIVSRGFVYVRESEDLMGEAKLIVQEAVESCLEQKITDWSKLKVVVKEALGNYIWKKTKRRPMLIPIIMEV